MTERPPKMTEPNQRERRENPTNFPIQREGLIESKINNSHFRYRIFLKGKPKKEYIYHLTTFDLGESATLTPQPVLDSEIDWDQIPYEDLEDAPYSPYTPRKKQNRVCFAPSPEQALLAIGKFKENISKNEGLFYIYVANREDIPNLKSTEVFSVLDSVDTKELRTEETVRVQFIGYIKYETIKKDDD